MFYEKNTGLRRVGSFPQLRQVSGSTVARLHGGVRWQKEGKVNEAIEGNPVHDVVFEEVDRQPTIPPIGGWYDSGNKTVYFVRTFSRPRMNR